MVQEGQGLGGSWFSLLPGGYWGWFNTEEELEGLAAHAGGLCASLG